VLRKETKAMHNTWLLLGAIPLASLVSIAGTRAYDKGKFGKIIATLEAKIADLTETHKGDLDKLKNVLLGAENQKAELRRELNQTFSEKMAGLQAELQKYKNLAKEYSEQISRSLRQMRGSAKK